jgi:hypothetical protein
MSDRIVVMTPRGSAHDGRPRLIARYASMDDACESLASLEAHGVDGDDVSLVGDAAVTAERAQAWPYTDRKFLTTFRRWIAAGILVGMLAGALVGAAIAGLLVLLESDFPDSGWAFALVVAFFAACGGLIGCSVAFPRRSAFSEPWPLTFEDVPGEVWLAVYADPAHVRPALEATQPLELHVDPDTISVHPDEL